ncbi:MAG: prepilin peptidase [Candidatus Methanomethylicia archaeon]|nr:prepilin peptidase [Candidatus Methanomethylicia archaeon]MCX8168875.1 prepilin peptidase [Candidatus Methanomethylicia archaeon]MDW7988607.1 A24 family peptidase C-terminal domain-containing protein [Nitrososphaerota archaeon]
MLSGIQLIRILIATLLFTIASWQDWKRREIDDEIWIAMTLIGIPLLIYEIWIRGLGSWFILAMVSITSSITIGLALYKLDFFGGADAKAIISLSILMPLIPEELTLKFKTHQLTSIATFNNSILISVIPTVYLLIKNIRRIINGEKIFQGLEDENILKKILALITGCRIHLKELKNRRFMYPVEEFTFNGNVIKRRLNVKIGVSIGEERYMKTIEMYEKGIIDGYVWVTPALPLIIFIYIGMLIAIVYGDIIFKLAITLSRATI